MAKRAGEGQRFRERIFKAFTREHLRRYDPVWKLSGRETVRAYLKARILPWFGRTRVDKIDRADVADWFNAASRDRPGLPWSAPLWVDGIRPRF